MRRNGVDIALQLLQQLGGVDHPLRPADLCYQIGSARSTTHRIAKALAAESMLELDRGSITLGGAFRTEAGTIALPRNRSLEFGSSTGRPTLPRGLGSTAASLMISKPIGAAKQGPFKIAFLNASLDNPWRFGLVHSIEQAIADYHADVASFSVQHADNNGFDQARQIQDLLKTGVDGLIISAVDCLVMREALRHLSEKRVPVIIVDRDVSLDISKYPFVTASDTYIAATMATWLAETLQGEGRVVLLAGSPDALPSARRLKAALKTFEGWPSLRLITGEWSDWQAVVARATMLRLIDERDGEIDGVWCDSGLQCIGSIQAFIESGYPPGSIPPHTGGGLNGAYKLAIRNRVPLVGVTYPPSMGSVAVRTLIASLRGYYIPSRIVVPSEVVITRGGASSSVRPSIWAEDHVRWDLPDDLVLPSGLAHDYSPNSFRVRYPGNRYNRSAAELSGD